MNKESEIPPDRSGPSEGTEGQSQVDEWYTIALRATHSALIADTGRAIIYHLGEANAPVDENSLKQKLARLASARTGKPLFSKGSRVVDKLLHTMVEGDLIQRHPLGRKTQESVPTYSLTEAGHVAAQLLQRIPKLADWSPIQSATKMN